MRKTAKSTQSFTLPSHTHIHIIKHSHLNTHSHVKRQNIVYIVWQCMWFHVLVFWSLQCRWDPTQTPAHIHTHTHTQTIWLWCNVWISLYMATLLTMWRIHSIACLWGEWVCVLNWHTYKCEQSTINGYSNILLHRTPYAWHHRFPSKIQKCYLNKNPGEKIAITISRISVTNMK